jgi:hypothetical protein
MYTLLISRGGNLRVLKVMEAVVGMEMCSVCVEMCVCISIDR